MSLETSITNGITLGCALQGALKWWSIQLYSTGKPLNLVDDSSSSNAGRKYSDTVQEAMMSQKAWQDPELLEIATWLFPHDPLNAQRAVHSRHQPGTGQWLFESDVFQAWLSGEEERDGPDDTQLLCYGKRKW